MTFELQRAAEGLESLSSALVNDHEEAKANARKLHSYCQHVSTVLGAAALFNCCLFMRFVGLLQ